MKWLIPLLLLPCTAFATLTVTDRGTGGNVVSGASDSITSITMAAGSTGVLCFTGDNITTVTNYPQTLTDSAGNTWIKRQERLGSVSSGNNLNAAIYTGAINSALSSGSITMTYAAGSITAKAWTLTEIAPTSGNLALYSIGGTTSINTTGTPSTGALAAVSVGGVVVGMGGAESTDTWVGDTGESNGDWSTKQSTGFNGGTTATSMSVISQYKKQTGTSVTSTYNPTLTSADCALLYIFVYEVSAKTRAVLGLGVSATTFVITPSLSLAAGSFGVLNVTSDNAGASGTTTVMPSSITDSAGNTWTRRGAALQSGGGVSSGAEAAQFTAPITVALDAAASTPPTITITWAGGVSVTQKCAILYEFVPTAGTTFGYVADGGAGAAASSTSPTITTSSIASGDYVIGVAGAEREDQWVADADTSNGNWSTQSSASIGSAAAAMSVAGQYKLTTGTATQTYNPTITTTSDNAINWVQIHETSTGPTAAQKAAFFMLFP